MSEITFMSFTPRNCAYCQFQVNTVPHLSHTITLRVVGENHSHSPSRVTQSQDQLGDLIRVLLPQQYCFDIVQGNVQRPLDNRQNAFCFALIIWKRSFC